MFILNLISLKFYMHERILSIYAMHVTESNIVKTVKLISML